MTKYFGTDGVRGVANQDLTPELVLRIGRAAALYLTEKHGPGPLVIGRDPRLSGQMLEGALIAGVTSVGVDVYLLGVVPTPAVALLAKRFEGCGGVMISASHNPLEDNGVKVFGGDGYKLDEDEERTIEELMERDDYPRPIAGGVGSVFGKQDAVRLYLEDLKENVPLDLTGLHIALDCANGATSGYAAQLFRDLGAEVTSYYDQPNGVNINHFCGSTFPEKIRELTKESGADLGFAFDGDGDRVLAVDEQGNLVNGDHILAIVGLHLLEEDRLPARKVIATAYSNGGLRQVFLDNGGDVGYAPAGDRFVLDVMLKEGCILGGEQSGHILFLENSTTGDGMLTALKLLETRKLRQTTLAELSATMTEFPQVLENVTVENKDWKSNNRVCAAIAEGERQLAPQGRLFVRASGTEPVIRVMAEHPNEELLAQVVDAVVRVIAEEQKGSYAG
jgi:phosphoglucosamine mutase